jgi:hypothetical protein
VKAEYDARPANRERKRKNDAKMNADAEFKKRRRTKYAENKEKRDAKDSTTGRASLRAFLLS